MSSSKRVENRPDVSQLRSCLSNGHTDRRDTDVVVFDSTDLPATERLFTRAYSQTTICPDGGQPPEAHFQRRWYGPVAVDDLDVRFHMTYEAAPMRRICLTHVRTGTIEEDVAEQGRDVLGPGDVALFCRPDSPYSGRVCNARYAMTMFDLDLLERVAIHDGEPVRLLGHRPVSAEAERFVHATIDYVRSLAAEGAPASPLAAASAANVLAGAVLSAFPNTAMGTAGRPPERTGSRPALLNRAIAFIEENAASPIVLSDVAAWVHVTPRALQYMFKRHLEMTPMAYLRRVRLDHAHRDLVDADPAETTVQRIADRWGFAHTGRFAAAYRQTYGRMPSDTLRY
ncbi:MULTISPECIES: helix-turn-helix transcriptional regulator [Mycobacteriaceae]|uniref:Helix-turn-helix domain-containing protein n=1 Tax=Mycolicibacterium parafortuitum TaxID=39692 RepID=A0ACC6MIC2_MYCPF|nr:MULTISPECIES: helix-turn-helix transcriptional regulator [Mycobacteriaceae]MDZ5086718.1 helix-turn-helix domain-containing protein [Mycolicibacterium parafortuitum]